MLSENLLSKGVKRGNVCAVQVGQSCSAKFFLGILLQLLADSHLKFRGSFFGEGDGSNVAHIHPRPHKRQNSAYQCRCLACAGTRLDEQSAVEFVLNGLAHSIILCDAVSCGAALCGVLSSGVAPCEIVFCERG